MVDNTTRLDLDLIASNQNQKHVTHNEAILKLDKLVQMFALDKDANKPPNTINEGDMFIVSGTPSDEWVNNALDLAYLEDGVWRFIEPKTGFMVWVNDEQTIYTWNGSQWLIFDPTGIAGGSGGAYPIVDRDLTSPPGSPTEGDYYIIAPNASGQWNNKDGQLAYYVGGSFTYIEPEKGNLAYVIDENNSWLYYDGTVWTTPFNFEKLNINAGAADGFNRLFLQSQGATFSHDPSSGSGSHNTTINKATSTDVGSIQFKTNYTITGEIGTIADDNLSFKVFAPGGTPYVGANIYSTDGRIEFPSKVKHRETNATLSSYLPTSFTEIWRANDVRSNTPRYYTITAINGDVITLSDDYNPSNTFPARGIFHFDTSGPSMFGNCYVRIWNWTKNPNESAWVKEYVNTTDVRVTDSNDISTWAVGDTIRYGDPIAITPLQMVAVDISPMMINQFGTAFPQTAISIGVRANGSSALSNLGTSGEGLVGTAVDISSTSNGDFLNGGYTVATKVLSPISNSNLVFFREVGGNAHTVNFLRILGLYVD